MEVDENEDRVPRREFDHQWIFPGCFFVSPFQVRSGLYTLSVVLPSHLPFPHPGHEGILGPPTTDVKDHHHLPVRIFKFPPSSLRTHTHPTPRKPPPPPDPPHFMFNKAALLISPAHDPHLSERSPGCCTKQQGCIIVWGREFGGGWI
ncbi:hypothetical protein HYDPIDRAFT_115418 [Hydnomerulius pinastri MD-312]|uniref:Uncharacterized protein n=1 Tax=Hydnomerulius pinastri MD-312 TaxID=994086 RepID=A0A0C9WCI5_9AGAM|nr:hypothetical protein HYDPIDRAFT_115418 [Hydnomerulius pinastri MD-312]